MPTCAIVSFRLGLTDGVSIVADTWRDALDELGFDTFTVAGEGPVNRLVPGLAIGAEPPGRNEVQRALRDADLVVVENLCTIPLNLPAALVLADVLTGHPAILHHHDPPWQRAEHAEVTELPPTDPAWRHVTINDLTRRQMAERGIEATTIYNGFDVRSDPDRQAASRTLVRSELGVADDEVLVAHPVRAIERKGIPEAVALCEALGATYWLLGEAELGYEAELERVLAAASCRVIRHSLPHGPDIYAAPDLVAFPSRWEGFGNPPVEASIHRRPVAVAPYPVGEELAAFGFEWFDHRDVDAIAAFLEDPDTDLLERNRAVAVEHFSTRRLTEALEELLTDAGWLTFDRLV